MEIPVSTTEQVVFVQRSPLVLCKYSIVGEHIRYLGKHWHLNWNVCHKSTDIRLNYVDMSMYHRVRMSHVKMPPLVNFTEAM